MVPEARLVPWFHLEESYHPTAADLAILETPWDRKISEPVVTSNADNRPKVSFQKLVMIPKVWAPYFMEPQLLWRVLRMFKKFMGIILDHLKESFDFIEAWFSVACINEVTKDESVVRAKGQNLDIDSRVMEWILRNICFVNFIPLMSGPHAVNNLDQK